MEISFKKSPVSCLAPVLSQVQNAEQTQELRIPEGMPEADKILCCWGQPVLRSKEWQGSQISISAGMNVWVLYLPEGAGTERSLQSWIPFQFRWDLPEGCPEGSFRVQCLPGTIDARLVSAGKISIRASLCAMAEVWCPISGEVYQPEELPERVELLTRDYPMRLPREAGEKRFSVEEMLVLPASAPKPERLLYSRMDPQITDSRVLGDRLVFRGNGNLHTLYTSSDGQVHSWDFELPFSQYTQLQDVHGSDAQGSVLPVVTGMELDIGEEGLHLRGELTGQYVVDDRHMVRLPEDAYIPGQQMTVQRDMLELPAVLDTRRENIYGEQTLSVEGDLVADSLWTPEFPQVRSGENGISVSVPGTLQLLYYDSNGQLSAASGRWEKTLEIPMEEKGKLSMFPEGGTQTRVVSSGDSMIAQITASVEYSVLAGQGLPMIKSLEIPGEYAPDPDRPSLILRRAEGGLWETAKECGSTVSAIQRANALENDPVPGQMLLIPVI